MTIEEIQQTFLRWDDNLTARQKRYIHFFSMRNFACYFEDLPSEKIKNEVLNLLSNYVLEVKNNGFDYQSINSYELIERYVNNISKVYKENLGFKTFIKFRFVLIFGVLGDGLLYFLLYNQLTFYFPIIFLFLLIYYLYIKLVYERKKKVFGIFY